MKSITFYSQMINILSDILVAKDVYDLYLFLCEFNWNW